MSHRYSKAQVLAKTAYRKFFPVPRSPWTMGEVEDICEIQLVLPKKLEKFFTNCIKKLKKIKGEEIGDYLEFGVFNGASISSMYKTAKKHNLDSMRFFGFDAFCGLPPCAEKEDDGVWKKGFYACSFEKMNDCLKRKKINPKEITFVKGWYNKTLNEKTIKRVGLKKLGIVFIDCDTYSSSKTVLDFIAPMITQPVIICLDDWKLNDLDVKGLGEYKSFNEFLEQNPQLQAKPIRSYNRKSRTFLIESKK